jgi:hypothetical protein
MAPLRAFVVGEIGSFRDCWEFRAKIAKVVGCSVRTVQRAITQAKSLGLIGVARAKKTEIPPGGSRPIECGWSHRWTIGWGKVGRVVDEAIAAARARWITRSVVAAVSAPTSSPQRGDGSSSKTTTNRHRVAASSSAPKRHWTPEELDAELERRARAGPD